MKCRRCKKDNVPPPRKVAETLRKALARVEEAIERPVIHFALLELKGCADLAAGWLEGVCFDCQENDRRSDLDGAL